MAHLGEFALLINEGDDVHRFDGDHVQRVLVVSELDVLPVDVLQVVLLLLQLEDMSHKELLQVFVGKVDAKLLEATRTRTCLSYDLLHHAPRLLQYKHEIEFC